MNQYLYLECPECGVALEVVLTKAPRKSDAGMKLGYGAIIKALLDGINTSAIRTDAKKQRFVKQIRERLEKHGHMILVTEKEMKRLLDLV